MREGDYRRMLAQLGQRKHAESALWALAGLPRMEPVEYYLSVLADVFYVAHNGVSRPHVGAAFDAAGRRATPTPDPDYLERVGRPAAPSAAMRHFESSPPRHDPRAQAMLRRMLKDLDTSASSWLLKLDEIVGESETL